jgi:hypothetical protein
MGYTHYWAFEPTAAGWGEGFARTATDAARIIAAAGIPLVADPDEPTRPPEVTAEVIWLDGIGEDGHETFALTCDPAGDLTEWHAQEAAEQGYWWDYCKTNWKPYDLVVCAVLIRAHQHLPDAFVFDSDGHWDDPSWRDAQNLIARVFGSDAVPVQDPTRDTLTGPPSIARRH